MLVPHRNRCLGGGLGGESIRCRKTKHYILLILSSRRQRSYRTVVRREEAAEVRVEWTR